MAGFPKTGHTYTGVVATLTLGFAGIHYLMWIRLVFPSYFLLTSVRVNMFFTVAQASITFKLTVFGLNNDLKQLLTNS